MPTVNNPILTLAPAGGGNAIITVTYDAVFTAFERQLVGFGTTYHSHVEVFGMDPPGSLTGAVIALFPPAGNFPVVAGAGDQIIPRTEQIVRPRLTLEEDVPAGDDDEIRCKIRIHTIGVLVPPPSFTPDVFTSELTLIS